MLNTIAKIAGKLDDLGLTKEADILDRFIGKFAQVLPAGSKEYKESMNSTGQALVGESAPEFPAGGRKQAGPDLYSGEGFEHPANPADPKGLWFDKTLGKAQKTGWAKYLAATPHGADVYKAWKTFSKANNTSPNFSAFAGWWKAEKAAGKFSDKVGAPSAVIESLSGRADLMSHAPGESAFVARSPGVSLPENLAPRMDGTQEHTGDLAREAERALKGGSPGAEAMRSPGITPSPDLGAKPTPSWGGPSTGELENKADSLREKYIHEEINSQNSMLADLFKYSR